MMEGKKRGAARAAPLEQPASSSHLRIGTAVAAPTEFLAAVSTAASTNKRRAAQLAATLLVLALLAVSEVERNSRSSSVPPTREVGFAAEHSQVEGLHRQDSATAMHVATRDAPWIMLAAAQKVGNKEKELPTRGTRFQGKRDLPAATGAGLQGRLRGSGGRLEALRIQQRGRQAEHQADRELPPHLPDAGESEKVRTLAAAEHGEDSVLHRSTSGQHARPSGAALTALHSMLDKASTHLRHLADGDLVAGADPDTEGTAAGRAYAALPHISENEAAKRGLQMTTEAWRKKYLPRVKEVDPAPVPHVRDDEANGHGITTVLELSTNEADSVYFDDDDDVDYSYGTLDSAEEAHISRENIRAALTDLNNMDVMLGISDKYYKPMWRESQGTPMGQNTGNADPVARHEDRVALDNSLLALLDRPHASENVKPMRITERRNAVTGEGETRRDAETQDASVGQSVPEDVTDTAAERMTDSGTAAAATAAEGEAATTPGAATPASLPQLGQYKGSQTSDLTRRYDTIAPWAPEEALQYFNRKPTSSSLPGRRPAVPFPLPTIPEVTEDSPSYFEKYPPPPPAHEAQTTAGSRLQWGDEQVQYLLNMHSPSVFQQEQTIDIEQEGQQKPPAHTENKQATSEDVIQAVVAQKLYHTPDSDASTTNKGISSNSAEGNVEKSSTTEASGKKRDGDVRKNVMNISGSSPTKGGSRTETSKPACGNRENSDVSNCGRGGTNGDQKSMGESRPGTSNGPVWRRPPVISTMGTPFMTRPYPSWFPYLPNSSNEKTEKPVVSAPGVRRPGTPFPSWPNSRDDHFQYPQILCQPSGKGPGCLPPRANGEDSRGVTRDSDTNADDVERPTAESTTGSSAAEDIIASSEEEPGIPAPGTPTPSSPDIAETSGAVNAFSTETDDEASVPPLTPPSEERPSPTVFTAPPPATSTPEADLEDIPLSLGVNADDVDASNSFDSTSRLTDPASSPVSTQDPPRPPSTTLPEEDIFPSQPSQHPPNPPSTTLPEEDILPTQPSQHHPNPPSATLPEEDILPSQPTIAVLSPQTPTAEVDSSAAVSAPIATGSNATVVSPRPGTSATGKPTLSSGTSATTTPFPAPFFPVTASYQRLPPFLPFPFMIPPQALPGKPQLLPFTASQLHEPLATVVSSLVTH